MKIAQINMVDYGSTGNLMFAISHEAERRGHEVKTFSMRWKNQVRKRENHTYFGTYFENGVHQVLSRVNGRGGKYSCLGTLSLIHKLKKFGPEIVHLHNLHNGYINLKLLFRYLRKHSIKTIWTLHDCWAFTGKCPHFVMYGCEKWKSGCEKCPALSDYPSSKLDGSRKMWNLKKKLYGDLENLTLITPSVWLSDLAKESFLKHHDIKVINNGIDLEAFQPRQSDFKQKYRIDHKKIVLGVSFVWSAKKGLDVFVRLANELPPDYQVVLVGVNENVKRTLPENILAIPRTTSKEELAKIYSAADVFVNPTREENFPTVNIEALACGTPIVTFNTGGSPECIDKNCGSVVDCDDVTTLKQEVIRVCSEKTYSREACLKRAKRFNMFERFQEYVILYEG